MEMQEIQSLGMTGALHGIERFDPTRGVKLGTFLATRIHGQIMDHCRNMDHVPRLVRVRAARMRAAKDVIFKKLGVADPGDDLLAEYLEIDGDRLDAFKAECRVADMESLQKVVMTTDDGDEVGQGSMMADSREHDPLESDHRLEFLRAACRGLSKIERLIVIGYYFLGQTMREIGDDLGLSESRVSQMNSQLLPRIKGSLERTGFAPFAMGAR